MQILRALLLCFFTVFSSGAFADDTALPSGSVFGGFVEDDGGFLLVMHADRDSFFVRSLGRRTEIVPLPGVEARSLAMLADGEFLMSSLTGSKTVGDRTARLDIVRFRGRQVRYVRGLSRPVVGYHYELPAVSGDGRLWAMESGDGSYSFGRFGKTGSGERTVARVEHAAIGERVDMGKWDMEPPAPVVLDSTGPVVLTPWNEGAYILHFTENGSSPYILPILFGDGVEEYDFRWQWNEQVLWARSSLYWKAYHLWDLGLSPSSFEEPFWIVENEAAEPHPLRGIVRVKVNEVGGYRVEHLWRDPWSLTEERQVSAWYQGRSPPFAPTVSGGSKLFVSASGGHAVIVEERVENKTGESAAKPSRVQYARHVELRPEPLAPPTEPDAEAEGTEDRARLTALRRAYEAKQREEAAVVGEAESSAAASVGRGGARVPPPRP